MNEETKILYEGKTKRIHSISNESDYVLIEFKDSIPIEAGILEVQGRAKLACETSTFLMKFLKQKGVDTHFVEKLEGPKIKCLMTEAFPTRLVCRNIATRKFADRVGIEENLRFEDPIIEFYLEKDNKIVMVSQDAVRTLTDLSPDEITLLKSVASSINYYLKELFFQIDLDLAEIRLRFGRTQAGHLVLADEITGETMTIIERAETKNLLFPCEPKTVIDNYMYILEKIVQSDFKKIPTRLETLYVEVMPRAEVKDPSSQAVLRALKKDGVEFIEDGKMGRIFCMKLKTPLTSGILSQINEMSIGLLSNPLSETHKLRMPE